MSWFVRGRPPGGWMLGWLFVTVLGIIWAVFLLPFLRRGGSPVTSVEEFERKMEFLAETNRGPPDRGAGGGGSSRRGGVRLGRLRGRGGGLPGGAGGRGPARPRRTRR